MNESNNRSVLHIDDDPVMLKLVHQKLTACGYDVISLNDPCKATASLLSSNISVVILDIDMPGMNGLDLLTKIKKQDGGIQVIMLTGLVSIATALQSLRWGAEACVFKPLTDFAPLLSALDAAFIKLDNWWESLRELTVRKRDTEIISPSTLVSQPSS